MHSPYTRETTTTNLCFNGCIPTPPMFTINNQPQPTKPPSTTTSRVENRRNFAQKTTTSLFPNTDFTNSDSLPSLQEAFAEFIRAYPEYTETYQIDQIRAREYYNLTLSNHVCLDYIGIGLYSFSQLHNQLSASTSSSPPPVTSQSSDFPVFQLSYKSVNLKDQLMNSGNESKIEKGIRTRIRDFLNVSEDDYSLILTANRTSTFKLLAESYPFGSCKKLLTVYDHDTEAVDTLINSSEKRGPNAISAEFTWPRLKIQSTKLRNLITSKRIGSSNKRKGLFVFQLQSRVTGTRYSYQWMKIAQENGWHVLLDACAVAPKDMDSLGLSIFQPDFIVCSFYKVFGENPSGFGCLFVKKSAISILESYTAGIVSIISAKNLFYMTDESSGAESNDIEENDQPRWEKGETSNSGMMNREKIYEISESEKMKIRRKCNNTSDVECRCLDHVDELGMSLVNSRSRYLVNWVIHALMKLQHPNADKRVPLVKIYGPKIKFDRGPALAFNVFDWKGEKVEPILIQKLADRKSISLSYGFLHHIWFSDKYEHEKGKILEKRRFEGKERKGKDKENVGIRVVTAAFGFIANFADAYRLWVFLAQFLDADFVEKERWRYTALNQKTVEF